MKTKNKSFFKVIDNNKVQHINGGIIAQCDSSEQAKRVCQALNLVECQKLLRKDGTPFKVGDRIWSIDDGFGVIKFINRKKIEIIFDENNNLLIWYDFLNFKGILFHASDPCLAIFGVEPEVNNEI